MDKTQQLIYTVSSVSAIVRGELRGKGNHEAVIHVLLIDSRKLSSPEHTLFIAVTSKRNDGHNYIGELYEKGVRAFLVSHLNDSCDKYPEASFILVHHTLRALQALSAHHREQFNIPVIGITGSNGKTIVKEWLYQLMSEEMKIVRSPKSFNSQIGVPLSVWQLKPGDELAIFEAGISEPDEMDRLQRVIRPTIGIFTNIGTAHDENFINMDQKVAEKLKLFIHAEALIFCDDHADVKSRIVRSPTFRNIKLFTWGRKQGADIQITELKKDTRKTEIRLSFLGQKVVFRIPFSDDASVENAMHCFATMMYLGMDGQAAAARMMRLHPVAMRMELKEGINGCTIINDSYSSDLNSLAIALDFLRHQKQHRKKTVILSDILQSGKNENELYSEIAEMLHSRQIERIIGIGPSIGRHAVKFKTERSFFPNTDDFLRQFPFSAFYNESILLKGARAFEFEKISKALQQKAHETVLEINLNALIHNLNVFRSRLLPQTKVMAMVKAFSYGSGSYEIANMLQYHQADYLAVAYADEGVELRRAGITLPVMVMNPDEESIDAFLKYDLEPEVYSFRILDMITEARDRARSTQQRLTQVHIKLDTGMYRLGFTPEDIGKLRERLIHNNAVRVKSVFSHLVASNDPRHDAFTREQISRFTDMSDSLLEGYPGPVLRHILNSAGISRFPQAQFDMVRLGIGLYGVPSDEKDEPLLQNVSTLRSTVSQVKTVKAGDTIGYNRSWKAGNEMQLAIVPVGYADGLHRILGNGRGRLSVNGRLCTIVGDICMDMCMADITGLEVKEGDPVVVFGAEYSITRLAEDLGTIPYEVLTGISRRVKRVYYQE